MVQENKIAIVGCSNGLAIADYKKIEQMRYILEQFGIETVISDFIYEKEGAFSGTGTERAEALMQFYRVKDVKFICDVSGGDLANEVLPYLDFDLIAQSNHIFCGYSDLTTIINAIYTMTGKSSILYQIRNLVRMDSENQKIWFQNTMIGKENDLFSFSYHFIQKDYMQGIVLGGNIRCLLKLAGTKYWPDMTGKILLLESCSGKVPQMVTFLNQLKQIGVFEQVRGILLGTFTQMQQDICRPTIEELVKRYAGDKIPIAVTQDIGHRSNSKAIIIGQEMSFKNQEM